MQLDNDKTLDIILNVGGRIFETSYDTLVNLEFFRRAFAQGGKTRNSGALTMKLDKSPRAFEHVLELLRNPKHVCPEKYWDDLEYYGIKTEKITIVPVPNFVKTDAITLLNMMYVKYIRHDPINNVYHLFTSSKKNDEDVVVFPQTLLYLALKNKISTLKSVPDPQETNQYDFIKTHDPTLFFNWSQVKFISCDNISKIFEVHFSTSLSYDDVMMKPIHEIFKISSEMPLYDYLKNLFEEPCTQIEKDKIFVRICSTYVINLNSIKYLIHLNKGYFEIYLSYKVKDHNRFQSNENSVLNDYFYQILSSSKVIPIAEQRSEQICRPNFVKFDRSWIINWNHVKIVSCKSKTKIKISLSSRKNPAQGLDFCVENNLLRKYLEFKLADQICFSDQTTRKNFVGFNETIVINMYSLKNIYCYKISEASKLNFDFSRKKNPNEHLAFTCQKDTHSIYASFENNFKAEEIII